MAPCFLHESMRIIRAGIPARLITRTARKEVPDRWRCLCEIRLCSLSSRSRSIRKRWAKRWRCTATLKKRRARRNPRYSGTGYAERRVLFLPFDRSRLSLPRNSREKLRDSDSLSFFFLTPPRQSPKSLGIALFDCAEGWRVHPTKSGQDRRREFNDRKPSPLGFRLLPVRGVQRGCHHIGLHAIDRRRHPTPRSVQRNRYCDRVLGHVDLAAGILWRA